LNIGFDTALDGTGKKREFLMSSTLRDISSTFKDVNAMLLENEDECMPSPLNQISSVEEDEVIDILQQICNGFKEVHNKNIIHRDIKPANFLIHKGVIKIADFGFARTV
jgi:serine/threonine protein kinase